MLALAICATLLQATPGEAAPAELGEHHRAHRAAEARQRSLADSIRRHVDPYLEAPAGNVVVFALGPGMTLRQAARLEEKILEALYGVEQISPIAGSVIKLTMRDLEPHCREMGRCLGQLAHGLDANFVITVTRVSEGPVTLELTNLGRAQVVASVAVSDDILADPARLVVAVGELFDRATPHPAEHPSHGVRAQRAVRPSVGGEVGTQEPTAVANRTQAGAPSWQPLRSPLPFWCAVAATSVVLLSAAYTSLDFQTKQASYNLLATGGGQVNGRDLVRLRAQLGNAATVGNGLWIATLATAVVSAAVAILTDWRTALDLPLKVAPTVGPGIGASAAFVTHF